MQAVFHALPNLLLLSIRIPSSTATATTSLCLPSSFSLPAIVNMSNRIQPLHQEEEDDVHRGELSRVERGLRDLQQAHLAGHRVPIIDLTNNEEDEREVLEYESRILVELETTGSDNLTSHRRRSTLPLRNLQIPSRLRVSSCRHNGILIKPGVLVEVPQRPRDEYGWQFLHVLDLYRDTRSENIIVRGIRLARQRYMRGLLPRMKNEVCALYDIDKSDNRAEDVQGSVEISVMEVICTRAFSRTNDEFPSHRFNRQQWKTVKEIEDKGNLVQRWKFCRYWPTLSEMATKKSYNGAVVHLRSTDIADKHFRVADNKRRNQFRGGIVRGGSYRSGKEVSSP